MIKIRVGLVLFIGIFIGSVFASAADQPTIVTMQNKQGEVLFHHEEHQAAVNNCVDCHHMGIESGGCRDCHGVDRDVPRLKHAFHRQCRNCHIKNGGPTECDTCHNINKKIAPAK